MTGQDNNGVGAQWQVDTANKICQQLHQSDNIT